MLYVILLIPILGVLIYLFGRDRFSSSAKKLSRSQENANLIKVLLELEEGPREQLFNLYRNQFGDNASRYASQTYQKWKAGTVRPNKQTFQRFLVNLPRVMSFELKCEVVRELREAYCAHDRYEASVATDNWKSALTPIINAIIEKALKAELPESLNRRLTWLAEDDVTAAHAILAESQARQSENALALLEKEFSNIEQLLDNARGRGKVTHVIRLPLGVITVQVRKGNRNE